MSGTECEIRAVRNEIIVALDLFAAAPTQRRADDVADRLRAAIRFVAELAAAERQGGPE